ncbi:MAG: hypothetical protein A2W90_15235 [Bacteroidetes bacterium GWF2_42_66]|nr:MAG: hypothetical protein A2W92_23665 [Bacteroidetes bacterium GWA2_42_15]OFX96850.1 MAG: hypothetical protein A2W89_19730 [Bacteroidetes bacterium GWE2_42_39]OFY46845.1 MAG: hypothetical protein A2W90_15235 [Bacteroidetes bacterium GWF2_42_66]HBL75113.1 hypothetical protein [Prolixibacteraceae bacterium]HCU60214.1 hypothetical protein [Prolixibacteraceae bacterium]
MSYSRNTYGGNYIPPLTIIDDHVILGAGYEFKNHRSSFTDEVWAQIPGATTIPSSEVTEDMFAPIGSKDYLHWGDSNTPTSGQLNTNPQDTLSKVFETLKKQLSPILSPEVGSSQKSNYWIFILGGIILVLLIFKK